MEYLIDTHVALWWWANDPHLSQTARKLVSDPDNTIFFSAISGYEILLKHRLGKLSLPNSLASNLAGEVCTEGWRECPVTLAAAAMAAQFSLSHRDLFDRILAAQAILSALPLISIDGTLDEFTGVDRIW